MKRVSMVLALALATIGAGSSARHDADVLVALGAGVAGTWETEFEFANPDSDRAVNVLAQMGINQHADGQIRLTRGGGGVMWGLLANVYDDGHVTVTAGKHP